MVARLFQEAGYSVTVEAPVPGRPERPADLLVHAWNGRPLAIDFTIVTPTAPSAARGPSAELLLDSAAVAKMRRNAEPCARAGWVCQPFVCDVFGAIRSDARKLITTLIQKRLLRNPSERPAEVGKRFWSAVTTAAVARAAVQLARLATLDCSELCPEGLLSLRTAREKTALPRGSTSAASRQSAAGSSDTMQLFDHPTGGSTLTGGVGATPSEATLTDAAESVGNGMGNHTPSQPSLPTTPASPLDATRSPLALSTKPKSKARVRAGGGESTVGGPLGGGSSSSGSSAGLGKYHDILNNQGWEKFDSI